MPIAHSSNRRAVESWTMSIGQSAPSVDAAAAAYASAASVLGIRAPWRQSHDMSRARLGSSSLTK